MTNQVYQLVFEHSLSFVDETNFPLLKRWKNPTLIDSWQPIQLEYRHDPIFEQVLGLHRIMIWQPELLEMLTPLLAHSIQALPVYIADKRYCAIHITRSVDCLDKDHSQFRRFKNRIIGIETYVLRCNALESEPIFTISEDGNAAIFVSDTIKLYFEEKNWTGLTFIPVKCV